MLMEILSIWNDLRFSFYLLWNFNCMGLSSSFNHTCCESTNTLESSEARYSKLFQDFIRNKKFQKN